MDNGKIVFSGKTEEVVERYLADSSTQNFFRPINISEIGVVVKKISLNEEKSGQIFPGKPLQIDIEIEAERNVDNIGLQLIIIFFLQEVFCKKLIIMIYKYHY